MLCRRHREPQLRAVVREFSLDVEEAGTRDMSGVVFRLPANHNIRHVAAWLDGF